MTDQKKKLRDQMDIPLIAAPMFLVSNPDLALECCKEGIVGSFPALNQRKSEDFEAWLIEMNEGREKLQKADPDAKIAPYAVNLIVHPTNPRLEEDLELCVKHKVPIIITSLGAVPELVDKVHAYGGIVLHDVTNKRHAKKAADAGVDGIIAVTAGAGGHAGTMNPVTLIKEIREVFDGIVVLAGGLTEGEDVLAAESMGADFAYMGTRFINTVESHASDEYKDMICEADVSDIIYTDAVSGVPANFMRQSLEEAGYDIEALKKAGANSGGKLKPLEEDAKAWKTTWSAGHGVGRIDDVPTVAELAKSLKEGYAKAYQKLMDNVPESLKKKPEQKPSNSLRSKTNFKKGR